MDDNYGEYANRLTSILTDRCWSDVANLVDAIDSAWRCSQQVFICGNGGSAANAVHIANDFLYGVGHGRVLGIRVEALSANTAVLTCLANDIDYSEIFSQQLKVKGVEGDVLIALSGSGQSKNIIRALETGNMIGMQTFAILGYTGGRSKELAQNAIHFPIEDMQISEDLQLVVGHMCMQKLQELSELRLT